MEGGGAGPRKSLRLRSGMCVLESADLSGILPPPLPGLGDLGQVTLTF